MPTAVKLENLIFQVPQNNDAFVCRVLGYESNDKYEVVAGKCVKSNRADHVTFIL